jgi:hypothetical protein
MGTPHFAPSAKFQLILQVFPRSPRRGFASKCPGGQKSVYGQDTLMEGLRRLKTGGRKDELVEAAPALLPRHRRDAAGASRWAGRVRTFGWDRATIGAGDFASVSRSGSVCVRACAVLTRDAAQQHVPARPTHPTAMDASGGLASDLPQRAWCIYTFACLRQKRHPRPAIRRHG